MKIGELSSATDTPVEAICFFEREGLLPKPKRCLANYRIYTAAHAGRLALVRHCRNLDMALVEVRELLRFKDASSGRTSTGSARRHECKQRDSAQPTASTNQNPAM